MSYLKLFSICCWFCDVYLKDIRFLTSGSVRDVIIDLIYEVFKNPDTSIDDIPSNDPNIGFNYYYNDISQSLT